MTNILVSIIILFFIILLWVWYMECCHPNFDETTLDEVLAHAKTGDLILFKATDNLNSSKIFSYYTHIGVVYKNSIFEAAGTRGMDLNACDNPKGIICSDLKSRLERYKGKLYYKQLSENVPIEIQNDFPKFIDYAYKNMEYNYNVLVNGILKGLGLEKCNNYTNCGELTMLSLIKLGILNIDKYYANVFHHLSWMANLTTADNNYFYYEPLKIRISPFG